MKNIALIFAGGTGQRMNSKTVPKQFLELYGKPIIIYTLEMFNNHPDIDGIVVVCLETWIDKLEKMIKKFDIEKVISVVPGGTSGQDSIFQGLKAIYENYPNDAYVLVHDGVRPLIDVETISKCIECVHENGSAITVVPAMETIVLKSDENEFGDIVDRKKCRLARAPQCFKVSELYEAHLKARSENRDDFIDSAQLMNWYGTRLFEVLGQPENIKITTPGDFYVFRAILNARENSQIFGL